MMTRQEIKKLIYEQQTKIDLKWGRLGDTDEYFWQTAQERDSNPAKSSDSTNQEQNNGNQPEKNA